MSTELINVKKDVTVSHTVVLVKDHRSRFSQPNLLGTI